MHDNDLWQVYADNDTPIPGKGATHEAFDADPTLIMGNAHIWFWKKSADSDIEIMLQKRGPTKKRPGWYHISAGGHINVGETPIEAAVREAKEEMGFDIDPAKLCFLHTTRVHPKTMRDIMNVYLYQLHGNEEFTHPDGEVESFEWFALNDFKEMIKDPEGHKLVPMGQLYFGTLVAGLEWAGQK